MKKPAIFFDRDNTLIVSDGYLGDPGQVRLIVGAAAAVARARALGFAVVTISNQSGVARGLFSEEAVAAVNAKLDQLLRRQNPQAKIDRHEFCPFHPEATIEKYRQDSELRKPKPGMILRLGLAQFAVLAIFLDELASGGMGRIRGASISYLAAKELIELGIDRRHRLLTEQPAGHARLVADRHHGANPKARARAAAAAAPTISPTWPGSPRYPSLTISVLSRSKRESPTFSFTVDYPHWHRFENLFAHGNNHPADIGKASGQVCRLPRILSRKTPDMPKRTDIHSILIIGSGPIVIGQGCEFDYSGVQACQALKEEGYRIVLVNSNPATIMTDPEFADATYIEPITPEAVEKILDGDRRPNPFDAVLPTLGGQTALNTADSLLRQGDPRASIGCEMIGANRQAILGRGPAAVQAGR